MNLAIYTYGYGDAMFNVLNSIKMIMDTQFFKLMIQMFAAISIVFAAGSYAASRGMNITAKPIIMRIAALYFVINLLITPKMSIWVIDRVTKTKQNVEGLPFAFVPIGWLEQVGDLMAGAIEQVFTPVADDGTGQLMAGRSFSYRDYGLAFGAQLMKESRDWRIQNPEFALNMNNFIRRCVMYEALIGRKYTEASLYGSPNAWELVKTKAGGFSRVILNINGNKENMSCFEAAQEIDQRYFTSEIELLKKKYLKSTISEASGEGVKPIASGLFSRLAGINEGKANSIFMKNLEQVHGNFLESGSGTQIIKQQLMLSALKTYHASSSYGTVRAKANQESTWATTGALAAEYLPIIFTLAKCLMYAGLLFLLPMMVLSGGIARYQTYLLAVASLQLWPSLYAILNMFIEMYTSNSVFGTGNNIISYTTYSTVGRSADKIAAIAGSLQIFIPFISYQIMQGSIGGFIQLAGNLISATQGAVAGAANEVTSGNRSIDNVSVGNMQMAMQSGFKTDFNQAYASGASNFQHTDGAIESVTASNDRAINSAHMKDQGLVSLNVHDSVEQGLTQNLESAESLLSSTQVSKKLAEEAQLSSSSDLLFKATENRMATKGINIDQSSEEARSMEKMTNLVEAVSLEKGISKKEASELILTGGVSTGILKQFGIDLGIETTKKSGSESGNSENQRETGEKQEVSRQLLNMTSKAAESESISKQFGIDSSTSEAVTANTHKVEELAKTESQAKEDVKRYSTALNNHKSTGGSMNTDGNHLVIERLKKTHNLTDKQAHDWFHSPQTAQQRNSRDQIAASVIKQEMSRVMPTNTSAQVQEFKNDYNNKDLNQQYNQGQSAINTKHTQNSTTVIEAANIKGVNKEKVATAINSEDNQLQLRNDEFNEEVDKEMDKKRAELERNFKDKNEVIIPKLMEDQKQKPIIIPAMVGTKKD